jgi:hypothetical protein
MHILRLFHTFGMRASVTVVPANSLSLSLSLSPFSLTSISLVLISLFISHLICDIPPDLVLPYGHCNVPVGLCVVVVVARVRDAGAQFTNFQELFLTRILNAILNRLRIDLKLKNPFLDTSLPVKIQLGIDS